MADDRVRQFPSKFEDLCALVLSRLGFRVSRHVRFRHDQVVGDIDIVANGPGGDDRLVEVKWSANPRVTLGQVRDWSASFVNLGWRTPDETRLIIASGSIAPSRRTWAESEFALTIWDRTILSQHAEKAGVADQVQQFLDDSDDYYAQLRKTKSGTGIEPELEEEIVRLRGPDRGQELLARLKATKPGKDGAKAYEAVCLHIIDYLFAPYLLDPRPQSRTEDDLNVMDIVYRVSPRHPFWSTLTRDFRARVIVFECKNYSKPIGPMQVYTTDRYMSVAALRSVCFLLSRKAPHPHAELAASGAMRDMGKLIVFLSDVDLAKMIAVRRAQIKDLADGGDPLENDPTIILDEKIYSFIARLPR